MMLWDIIRDWFVMNIWGGYNSNGEAFALNVGLLRYNDLWEGEVSNLNDITLRVTNGFNIDGSEFLIYIGFADWLSTTSTIIVLCLLCAFLIMCVIWLFKFFAGLFKW